MASYPETDTWSNPDFAAQASRDAFGRHYVRPRDRDFRDHGPRWQQLGDISDGVVDRLRRRRDHHLADLEIDLEVEHDTVEV